MSAVGVPPISAAYSSVRKEELPMATTSLNIVQRLGGAYTNYSLRNGSGMAARRCSFAGDRGRRFCSQLCPTLRP
jgi:hypothetical protein